MIILDLKKTDHLVAVNLADAANEPAIARVVKVSANDVVVQWLKGSYLSACKPWKLQRGKKVVPWEDTIPKGPIILYDFQLSAKGDLRKTTIEHLKASYNNTIRYSLLISHFHIESIYCNLSFYHLYL